MTRRERLLVLLDNFMDVEHGLQDRGFRDGELIPRMCRAWSHPSYVELRRCVVALRDAEPVPYWNLAETYFRAPTKIMAYCQRCKKTAPAGAVGQFHRHGQTSLALVPRAVRVVSKAVRPEEVSAGVDWLEREFRGEVFIPDDLLPLAA